MKFSKLFICWLAVGITAVLMFACSDAPPLDQETEDVGIFPELLTEAEQIALAVQNKGTYEISESEALEILKRFVTAKSDEQGVGVKSAEDSDAGAVDVKSATLKTSKKTGRPMYFELVFDNADGSAGFSLVAADERLSGVLAFSEGGSMSDTTFNKSLKFALGLVDVYAEEQIEKELDIDALAFSANQKLHRLMHQENSLLKRGNKPPDHTIDCTCNICLGGGGGGGLLDPEDPGTGGGGGGSNCGAYYGTITESWTDQILKQIPGGWHQRYPYNSLLPYINNDETNYRAFVGCGAIAVSQIMSYHKRQYYSNGSLLISVNDWNNIVTQLNPGTVSLLQHLLSEMFWAMKVSTTEKPDGYDETGTQNTITTAINFINDQSRHNFTAGAAITYSFQLVKNALVYGPTYIEGFIDNNYNGGHAWVIDGAKTVHSKTISMYESCEITKSYSFVDYVRCDWGWGNSPNNTWFKSSVFTVSSYNFNSNLRIISSIQ